MLKDSVMVATSRVLSLRKSRYISNCRANVSRDTSMSGTLAPIQHHPSAHSGQIYFTDHTFIELIVIVHSHHDLYTSIGILQRTVVHYRNACTHCTRAPHTDRSHERAPHTSVRIINSARRMRQRSLCETKMSASNRLRGVSNARGEGSRYRHHRCWHAAAVRALRARERRARVPSSSTKANARRSRATSWPRAVTRAIKGHRRHTQAHAE